MGSIEFIELVPGDEIMFAQTRVPEDKIEHQNTGAGVTVNVVLNMAGISWRPMGAIAIEDAHIQRARGGLEGNIGVGS